MITSHQFLKGLIPPSHFEITIDKEDYYACRVKGPRLKDKEWDDLAEKIMNEFGDNLMEIDSNTNYGVDFIVFLRK